MEPFDLTFLQEPPSNDSENSSSFDSFNNVVNYDESFSTGGAALPLNCYKTDSAQYTWKGITMSNNA